MENVSGATTTNEPVESGAPIEAGREDLGSLAAPNRLDFDPYAGFTAPAAEHPALLTQLRGSFFARTSTEFTDSLPDGGVLKIAALLYSNDDVRRDVVNTNRQQGRPLLALYPEVIDELLDREDLPPKHWEDLPEPLRLIDQALRELPREYLAHNPLFVPTPELVAFTLADPGSDLARSVAQNANLTLTPELVDFAIAHPYSRLTTGVAQNPRFFTW